jgi:bifunctional non-homologous end joining protein LigD
MALEKYKQKRNFRVTTEPTGKKHKPGKKLIFVVQEHHASHLHYDFRLEMKGVLKSWAVPKGPSLDPAVKRLAMMVEDHPYEYHTFHGTIPAGQYGAGTVKIWDKGWYESYVPDGGEKELFNGLKKGDLKFILHGRKLKGAFVLVHTKGEKMKENSWLLIKKDDVYAQKEK